MTSVGPPPSPKWAKGSTRTNALARTFLRGTRPKLVAVVAHHEILAGGDADRLRNRRCRATGETAVVHRVPCLREIRLLDALPGSDAARLDEQRRRRLRTVDLERVAGNADHALDEILGGIGRRDEHDDVPALRIPEVVGDLAREEKVVVLQGADHALAIDAHRLEGAPDGHVENERDDDHLEDVTDEAVRAAPPPRPGDRGGFWLHAS